MQFCKIFDTVRHTKQKIYAIIIIVIIRKMD
nr:MAG TPA: hypothetical protein [Caudoviricetes sp.]DAJ80371.1 MAG TPA: hypothetical protein [Caudoviricetes sp.]